MILPLPKRSQCTYFHKNTHIVEECPRLITKWEYHEILPTNFNNFEPWEYQNLVGFFVTHEGARIGMNQHRPNYLVKRKASIQMTRYD